MTNRQKTLAEYDELLALKERDLLVKREEVWAFLDTEHTSGDTKKYQASVRKADTEISTTLRAILGDETTPKEFRTASKDLCQRWRDLQSYTRDMNHALADDLAERRHAEDKKTIDVIKNVGFCFTVTGGLITAVKNGVLERYVSVSEAALGGVVISAAFLNKKRIWKGFKAAGKAVVKTPTALKAAGKAMVITRQDVRDSPLIFYVREKVKESGRNVASIMRLSPKPQARL